jgi:hypothetical protein
VSLVQPTDYSLTGLKILEISQIEDRGIIKRRINFIKNNAIFGCLKPI